MHVSLEDLIKVERRENIKRKNIIKDLMNALIEFYNVYRKRTNTNCWRTANILALLPIVLNMNVCAK